MEHSQDINEAQRELRPEVCDALLDPMLWHSVLEEYALAMNLAVVLTDTQGRVLGKCINPQPLWSLFEAQITEKPGSCPFCLLRTQPCTAIADALHQGEMVLTGDRLGLAHFVVPLQLGNQQLGTLIAGQVFDQFPDRLQLELEQNAKRLDLLPQQIWKLASQQRPVTQTTLRMYAKLLSTLGHTFIETRYHTLMESERSALFSRLYEQLRRSEQQYRLLAEALPQFVWNSLPNGQVTYCNQHGHDYTGLMPEQAADFAWATAVHPADQEHSQALWQQALRIGESYKVEYRLRRAEDGQYRWHWASIGPVRDRRGHIISWVGTAIDIEDRKQAENLLQRKTEQLIQANQIKDEFLAVLSHELRSPLNPILGWSKLLQTRKFDPQTAGHALTIIERNAQLQAQLIGDLLDVSRILQGKLSLDISPVDLVPIIQSALETVRLAAIAKSINLRLTIADTPEAERGDRLPWIQPNEQPQDDPQPSPDIKANMAQDTKFQVLGDASRLQQIIWNLLSNAVKFTPEGGHVDIYLRQETKTADAPLDETQDLVHPASALRPCSANAQIMVRDSGKGIHPDFLPYVFDYFRQADSTITRRFGGLGLGLAIVHRLVELHGGTIQAESLGEEQGATFTVRLPLQKQDNAVTQDAIHPLPSHVSHHSLNGIRILIVEDEIDTREFIAFLLQQYGATVTAVASAMEAIAPLTQSKLDVLISDIGMPDVDGYMLLRQVRSSLAQSGQVPAIALTAYAGEIDHQRAIAAGFQQHLSKPVEPEQLVQAIVQVMAQPISHQHQQ